MRPFAADGHRDVVEGHAELGVGLVHGDLDGVDQRVRQAEVGQTLGEGLEQVDRLAGEHRVQLLGEAGVVDRAGQVVTGRGGCGVELQDGVYAEGLTALALPVVDAVVRVRGDAPHGDPVAGAHRRRSRR